MSNASEAIRLADEAKARAFAKAQIEILKREQWVVELAWNIGGRVWQEIQILVNADSDEDAIYEAHLIASTIYEITPMRVNHITRYQDRP